MRPNLVKVLNLFQPDVYGHSDWVTIEKVIESGLSWSNNGNVRRGVAFGVSEYDWSFKRAENRKIVAMRLCGYNETFKLSQSIRKDIVDELRMQTRSNFSPECIIPLVERDKEIDHRWGRKDSVHYEYINDLSKQSINDFQLLSHTHNLFKREQCVRCTKTNIRYSPPDGHFKIGCEKWEDEVGCMGCPLAQPELYR